jgi:hypothetical protein
VADTTEDAILRVLRANEGVGLGRVPVGLMSKEVAEQTKLSLGETQKALNDMAQRGLVHRSFFYWYSGRDPARPALG